MNEHTTEERLNRLEQTVDGVVDQLGRLLPDNSISDDDDPWSRFAGAWKDHPDVDDVTDYIAKYRSELDADPERA